jgi:glycosyltransferase involved in cell wall biosynthesis
MKIGFDAKRYFNNRTGLGNYSRSVVDALLAYAPDHQYVLFAPGQEGKTLPSGLRVAESRGKGSLWRMLGMKNDLIRNAIQVYHGLSNEIPVGLAGSGIKTVVTIHDLIFRRYPNYYRAADRFIYNVKTNYACRYADVIVAASQTTAADIKRFCKIDESRMRVVYQPVDYVWYEKPELSVFDMPYILYVSSFTHRKNHGSLIEAFAKIQKQNDMQLVLAGAAGETLEKCRTFVNHEKLNDRVHFYVDCDFNTLHSLVYHSALVVNCSFFEGFGIPLAEAAVCGRPMAVSGIPVFKEIAGSAARYFNPNDTDDLAAVMMESLSNEYQSTMEEGRKVLLDKIHPAAIAGQLNSIYQSLC